MTQGTPLVRFGAVVGAATLASLIASAPGALRLSAAADIGLLHAWLTLAGVLVVPMIALVPIVRLARDGLRGVAPDDGAHALERSAAVSLFACTWLWFLSAFGAMLRATTHQRALGAVTFAFAAASSMVFLGFVARRLVTILARLRARLPALGTAASLLVIALSLALVALRVARAAPELPLESRATMVDGLAIALALAFAARRAVEELRALARWGPPIAVCVLVVSIPTLTGSHGVTRAMARACPLYHAIVSAVLN